MSPPVFGKRNVVPQPAEGSGLRALAPLAAASDPHAAFFAAVRAELAETGDQRRMIVPRSYKAASLAGLVVGCGLAGFAVSSGAGEAIPSSFETIAAALGAPPEALQAGAMPVLDLAPVTMLLGLWRGARIAALTLLVVHGAMSWLDVSSRLAYAIGGALVSGALAAALLAGLGHPPAHGWAVELAAGATAGFLYRVLAGVRPA